MSEWSKRHGSYEDSRGRSVSTPALSAWVYYSYLPYLSYIKTGGAWESWCGTGWPSRCAIFFFFLMSSAWCSVNSIQNINCQPKHTDKKTVVSSVLIESFLMTVCAFWLSAWVRGWPSVTGNIPGCLKVASTCCGKPTARCRQRKAALKKTNISSEMRFSSIFPISFLFPVM